MQLHPKKSLVEHLSIITDPRVNRTKDHALIDLLVIAIRGLLCRAEMFNDLLGSCLFAQIIGNLDAFALGNSC
jgi:hypothetical protein